MTWCNAAHRYMSKNFGDKGNCGFMKDETTGSQKILFDALSPEMKQVVEKLQPGQLSKPQMIRTPDGRQVLRIIYLRAFIPPHEANLTQDYGRIQVEAEAMKKQNVLNQWVEKTRKTTYIRINHEYLNCPDLYLWEESE